MRSQIILFVSVGLCASFARAFYGFQGGSVCGCANQVGQVGQGNPFHYHGNPIYAQYAYGAAPQSNIQGNVFENIIAAAASGASPGNAAPYRYGSGSPFGSHVDVVHAQPPSSKIVNIQVGVEKQPGYAILRRTNYQPVQIPASGCVKFPSVAVRERQAVYSGAELQRTQQVVPRCANSIIKRVDVGC